MDVCEAADLHWEMSKSDEVKQREKEYEERDLHTKKNKNTYRKLVVSHITLAICGLFF